MTEADLVLFDLDGTLVDTAPDMARALNELVVAEGGQALPYARIRPHVSNGAAGLLRLAFGDGLCTADHERLRQDFLTRYADDIARESLPFPGMTALLAEIAARDMRWGVVTNKPGWLTTALLDGLGLSATAACVVAGDTLNRNKPDPAPIHHACELVAVSTARTVYVGDAERDIVAGRAAGTHTLVALFGYLEPGADPADWQADGMLAEPADLWQHVSGPQRPTGTPETTPRSRA